MKAIEFHKDSPLPYFDTKYPVFSYINWNGAGNLFDIAVCGNTYCDRHVAILLKMKTEEYIRIMAERFNCDIDWGTHYMMDGKCKTRWYKEKDIAEAVEWCNSIIMLEILTNGFYDWGYNNAYSY